MKLAHQHQCDQCGQVAPWDEHWRRYSSIRHDETCPELMPELCSDGCRELFSARLETGEVRLPKLSNHRKRDKGAACFSWRGNWRTFIFSVLVLAIDIG